MAGEKVLVVDDSRVYRDLVVNHILQPSGYESLAACDGAEGLQTALCESPDLIVLDMQMPGLTGIEVLEALRAEGRDIPVILMTIHGSEEAAVRAFRLGARDYVIKPFDVDELTAAMERALSEVRLRREKDALTRQLEAQHRQLEAVLANTDDAVILVGEAEGDPILLVNGAARRAFGIDGGTLGQPLAKAITEEILIDAFHRGKSSSRSARAEISLPDGRTLNAHVTPILNVGCVAVMQDITHLKELDRMKSEFVTTVSHDLRSPLTSIKGFAELMPVVGSLNEMQTNFLDRVQKGIDNLAEMVTDLLDLGHIESEVNLEFEQCDLGNIVAKATARHQSNASYKSQLLQCEVAPGLPSVWGNPLRLGQAVYNLVGNSVKYTPDQGKVVVTASQENGHVVVMVEDNGIGISAADRPYIFDKFYRVKSEETDAIVGSGLGLSIVKSIIEKHQGRIWVESQPGEGSTFTFMLPAISQSAGP